MMAYICMIQKCMSQKEKDWEDETRQDLFAMKNEEEKKDKKVQDALNKLISDEWFAGNVYKQFVVLVD